MRLLRIEVLSTPQANSFATVLYQGFVGCPLVPGLAAFYAAEPSAFRSSCGMGTCLGTLLARIIFSGQINSSTGEVMKVVNRAIITIIENRAGEMTLMS